MKIPAWFDIWLLEQKNKQGTRAVGGYFFWEIMCWRAYTKGKKAGLDLARTKILEATDPEGGLR